MKKLKEKIDRILDTEIRELFGRLSPAKRLAVALSLLSVMSLAFVSVIGYGLYRIGHDDAMQQMQEIRSIAIPNFIPDTLPRSQRRYLDSIRHNRLNDLHDDTTGE